MAKAWIFQDPKQVQKYGAGQASYYVGWFDPEGKRKSKSCGPGAAGKGLAEKLKKKTEAELLTGTYRSNNKSVWKDFRDEYRTNVLAGLAVRTREQADTSLAHFERIVKPVRMLGITTQAVDNFI